MATGGVGDGRMATLEGGDEIMATGGVGDESIATVEGGDEYLHIKARKS